MSSANFARCLPQILKHEGGFTKNPKDPGNWTGGKVGVGKLVGTLKGIAASSHPGLDIPNLSDAKIASIYRAEYWTPAGCDALPVGLDLAVFDPAVNSGVSRAKKWLGAAGAGSTKARIQKLCAARLAFLRGLPTFKTFGKGWTTRVAKVEATAVSWALAATGASSSAVAVELQAEAKKATVAKKVATKATATSAGGAVVAPVAPTDAVLAPELWPYAVGVVAVILIVTAIVFAYRAHVQGSRADAYSKAAANV